MELTITIPDEIKDDVFASFKDDIKDEIKNFIVEYYKHYIIKRDVEEHMKPIRENKLIEINEDIQGIIIS